MSSDFFSLLKPSVFNPYLNTCSMFDLATGAFLPGMDGNSIGNGGLTYTNGVTGRPQTWKSTTAIGMGMAATAIYPDSKHIIDDTEFILTEKRIISLANDILLPDHTDYDDRVKLVDKSDYEAEALLELIYDIGKEKEAHKGDYTVESPFIDPKTGGALKIWIPTIMTVDSFSKLSSKAVQAMYDKHNVSDTEMNTIFMKDGLVKSKFMSQLPSIGAKYGIYFILTAHIGNKIEMNPYAATPKDLQHMKQTDKIKHVGADFTFLTSNLIEMRSAKNLQSDDKDCLYPDKFSSPTELNLVTCVVCRCKNNASGGQVSPVVSQSLGMQNSLTNYHYLKDENYFGLVGNNKVHAPCLCPDNKLQRTTVRDKLEDYKTARAIEILTQLCYIKNSWVLRDMPVDFNIPIEKFAEALLKNQSYAIDDILNSRGYWTYDKKNPRSYLSILDILGIIEGKYKPKWIGVKTVIPFKKAA